MKSTWFKSGDWNAICDRCGFKFKASQLRQTWDGLMVCSEDWESRHPQEQIRPIPDQNKLPWTRPEGADVVVSGSIVTETTISSSVNRYILCSGTAPANTILTVDPDVTIDLLIVVGTNLVTIQNYGTITLIINITGDGLVQIGTPNIIVHNFGKLGPVDPIQTNQYEGVVAVSTTLTIASGINHVVVTNMTNNGTIENSGNLLIIPTCS